MKEYKLTILTPTYNRGVVLKRLYESLLKQTYRSFEWVIINDGATDNTDEIVSNFINEGIISIKYKKKINGGKPSAHNEGVMLADSDLTIICDDDDYFVKDALKIVVDTWKEFLQDDTIGLIGYRGTKEETPLNDCHFPKKRYGRIQEIFPSGQYFDTTQIYKTDILKRTLFPITSEEKFVPEVWLWNELDKYGKLIIIHKVLEICKYREDGLTKTNSQTMWNNPKGYSIYFLQKYEKTKGLKRVKYYNVYKGLRISTKSEYKRDVLCSLLGFPIFMYVFARRFSSWRKR